MTSEQFCHWLKGVTMAISDATTPEQWGQIRESVNKVVAPNLPAELIGQQDLKESHVAGERLKNSYPYSPHQYPYSERDILRKPIIHPLFLQNLLAVSYTL